MNGTGFPFGLDRTNIPLEWKLYSVIRAYETLCCMQNPKHVLDVMQEWCDSCYFDENIFRSFRDSTKKGVFTKIQSSQRIPPRAVSYHRMNRYRSFVTSWYKILDIMRNIEANYQQGRLSSDDAQMKNITFKRANELRLQLLQVADIRKLIVITRHGETESDTEGWPPWDDDEFLTEQWEMTSLMKWEAFEGLNFRLFASPLIRSQQTAAIICQKVNSCTRDIILNDTTNGFSLTCASCPFITLEETIANPKKNREDDRYNSYAHKLFADDNMKWLIEFLTKLAFSSKESVNLFIAHRDSARNLIFWLRNLFEQNGISGEKTPIGNDTIYEFLFRWDHLVRWRENRTKGLIFSVANWKPLLSEINTIVMSVFGEIFYTPDKWSVNLIALHDVLLDFLDRKIEECPEDFDVFLERILARDITKDLFEILKRERIIQ